AYVAISTHRESAKACLLDRITDATPMTDPRSEPTKTNGFVVGDLALFLLCDFEMVSFDEVLPIEVRAKLPERGVFEYFEWVQKRGNRKLLQSASKAWAKSHASKRRPEVRRLNGPPPSPASVVGKVVATTPKGGFSSENLRRSRSHNT
ncbi:MAG: hypothetical protein ACREP7_00890, partial [Lysobacter sp.]